MEIQKISQMDGVTRPRAHVLYNVRGWARFATESVTGAVRRGVMMDCASGGEKRSQRASMGFFLNIERFLNFLSPISTR